jgi:hypothetical protein
MGWWMIEPAIVKESMPLVGAHRPFAGDRRPGRVLRAAVRVATSCLDERKPSRRAHQ